MAPDLTSEGPQWPRLIGVALTCLTVLYGAFYLYQTTAPIFGFILLALAAGIAVVFGSNRFYGARFIFPGVAAVLIFIAFPVLYTVFLGFTNYASTNLLTYERAIEVLTARSTIDPATEQPFALIPEQNSAAGQYRIHLPSSGQMSDPLRLDGTESRVALSPGSPTADPLPRREAIKLRAALQTLTLVDADGAELQNAGLRSFARVVPDYARTGPDQLTRADGTRLTANHETGFFQTETGEALSPGWLVYVGLQNFKTLYTSEGIRGPMISIFVWTIAFAALTVFGAFALGLLLAVILQWEYLRFKPLYRILLILPYAVPAFISILVFRGLFNQNFGEINLILNALFGLRPDWFTDGTLARIMILVVNIWLGYPYMMLLAMGFLQAVPTDHKKAAALEGASSLRIFFRITLPQILPPFLPLLIAAFAFNFNNLMLILLLTRGGPDIPGTIIPAGETDILASFTYRLAFMDSGQQFGLAGAITLVIFTIVAVISYVNFAALRRAAGGKA